MHHVLHERVTDHNEPTAAAVFFSKKFCIRYMTPNGSDDLGNIRVTRGAFDIIETVRE